LDEVFGVDNFLRSFLFKKTGYLDSSLASSNFDYILWYAKLRQNIKHRGLFLEKTESKSFVGQRLFIERKDGSRCLAKWRDPDKDPELHLFGQLKRITKQWLDNCLTCKPQTLANKSGRTQEA